MAFLETFFRISRKGQIGLLRLDARINEVHTFGSSVSNTPSEIGRFLSNQVTVDTKKLSITAMISEVPVAPLGSRYLEDKIYDLTTLIPGSTVPPAIGGTVPIAPAEPETPAPETPAPETPAPETPAAATAATAPAADPMAPKKPKSAIGGSSKTPADAFKYLTDLVESRATVSVITALGIYNNMAITSLSCPKDAQVGRSLVFSAQLEEVRVVDPPANPKEESALKRKNKGQMTGMNPNAQQNKSFLKAAAGNNQVKKFLEGVTKFLRDRGFLRGG